MPSDLFVSDHQPRSQGLSLPAPQSSGGRGERDPGNEVERSPPLDDLVNCLPDVQLYLDTVLTVNKDLCCVFLTTFVRTGIRFAGVKPFVLQPYRGEMKRAAKFLIT